MRVTRKDLINDAKHLEMKDIELTDLKEDVLKKAKKESIVIYSEGSWGGYKTLKDLGRKRNG